MAVTWHKHEGCGFVVLNNPPVNAINQNMREGLINAVKWAEREELERVILSGEGRGFAAGASTWRVQVHGVEQLVSKLRRRLPASVGLL